MPKIHKGRPPTYEADIPASDLIVPKELREEYREALEAPSPRPTPRPRHTRVQAGHARGAGKAKSP